MEKSAGGASMPRLRDHQREGIDFMRPLQRSLLFDEPGMGKSRQLLEVAEGKTLVLAPAMALDAEVWIDQVEQWAPGKDVFQLSYSSLCRREGNRPVASPIAEVMDGSWDTFIFDEAHYLKGRDTKWTLATLKLLKAFPDAQVRLATGTPIPNFVHELFVLLCILYPEKARPNGELGSYWRWVEQHFRTWTPRWGGRGHIEIGRMLGCSKVCEESDECPHWEAFHDKWLAERAIGRTWGEGDLPPTVVQEISVPMTPEQRRVYNALKRDFYAELETGEEIVLWHKGSVASKIRKVCTGLELLDPNVHESGKFNYLREILPGRPHPVLVVAHHRDAIHALMQLCEKLKLRAAGFMGGTPKSEAAAIVKDFQAGKYDVLGGTLDYISEAVTLTRADTILFLEQSWVPSRNDGAFRRIARLGQERPIHVIYLRAANSYDQRVVRLTSRKSDRAMRALRPREFASLL